MHKINANVGDYSLLLLSLLAYLHCTKRCFIKVFSYKYIMYYNYILPYILFPSPSILLIPPDNLDSFMSSIGTLILYISI